MVAPLIVPYDRRWPRVADDWMARVRAGLAAGSLPAGSAIEHIGSTAVPGLAAKPFLDLQLLVTQIPEPSRLESALRDAGFVRALGSRPDSPGVHTDIPRPGCSGDRHEKVLLFADTSEMPDPIDGVILHVRRADSPFADFVRAFRDWLRADPDARARYETTKRELAAGFADAADYDDYTRAKSAFMDDAQAAMAWTGR
ncbi:GrpB family protein [Microbacterium sp. M28]|uniref:GrpB family protein n=1 Tax=Microbacterium sp. M28 TaxID=2962064 RepID=UPI0021F4C37A|nr:GrpB family protein [Microbacterium sp. M28]UYO98603.1 GrpB family protein [Microbacterium sp. M28]